MDNILIKIKRLNGNELEIPSYKTYGSAGFDLSAYLEDSLCIKAGEFILVPTGLAMEIPEGYELEIRPRSGLAIKHGITVLNSPGTIDSDYRGEIKIILHNVSKQDFYIKNGDRIAQGVLKRVYQAKIIEVEELTNTDRGTGGFGHTGIRTEDNIE